MWTTKRWNAGWWSGYSIHERASCINQGRVQDHRGFTCDARVQCVRSRMGDGENLYRSWSIGYSTGKITGRATNTVPVPVNTVPVAVRVRYNRTYPRCENTRGSLVVLVSCQYKNDVLIYLVFIPDLPLLEWSLFYRLDQVFVPHQVALQPCTKAEHGPG